MSEISYCDACHEPVTGECLAVAETRWRATEVPVGQWARLVVCNATCAANVAPELRAQLLPPPTSSDAPAAISLADQMRTNAEAAEAEMGHRSRAMTARLETEAETWRKAARLVETAAKGPSR